MKLAELFTPRKVLEGRMAELDAFLEQDIKLEEYEKEEAMAFLNGKKDFDQISDDIQVKFEAWMPNLDIDPATDSDKIRDAVLKAIQ